MLQQQQQQCYEQEMLEQKQNEQLEKHIDSKLQTNSEIPEINNLSIQSEDSSDKNIESFKTNLNPKLESDNIPNMLDKCLQSLKSSVIVGALLLVLLLPVTTQLLEKILPNKEFIQNNLTIIINGIKALLEQ